MKPRYFDPSLSLEYTILENVSELLYKLQYNSSNAIISSTRQNIVVTASFGDYKFKIKFPKYRNWRKDWRVELLGERYERDRARREGVSKTLITLVEKYL